MEVIKLNGLPRRGRPTRRTVRVEGDGQLLQRGPVQLGILIPQISDELVFAKSVAADALDQLLGVVPITLRVDFLAQPMRDDGQLSALDPLTEIRHVAPQRGEYARAVEIAQRVGGEVAEVA